MRPWRLGGSAGRRTGKRQRVRQALDSASGPAAPSPGLRWAVQQGAPPPGWQGGHSDRQAAAAWCQPCEPPNPAGCTARRTPDPRAGGAQAAAHRQSGGEAGHQAHDDGEEQRDEGEGLHVHLRARVRGRPGLSTAGCSASGALQGHAPACQGRPSRRLPWGCLQRALPVRPARRPAGAASLGRGQAESTLGLGGSTPSKRLMWMFLRASLCTASALGPGLI